MGLISAALGAAAGTISDQWKEYFWCDALPSDTLVVRGQKKTKGFGNYGNDNVITDGSIVNVADGQCMIIVENGQIAEICAEPGEYRYDNTAAPSVLTGSLSESVKQVFAEIGKRFEFGGAPTADQRVYYINTKEMTGNKYGTPSPVPFRVVDERAGIDIDISVKCFGEYSYHIADPILFYTNVCGNVKSAFKRSDIEDQMKTELLTALQPAFAKISAQGIRYSELPGRTTELCDALNEALQDKWQKLRGIEILSIGVNSVKADEEDEKMIKEMQRAAAFTDPKLAAANTVAAQSQAVMDAAKNENGAVNAFVGMNAAQSAGGINVNALYEQAGKNEAASDAWTCPKCGKTNEGKFCSDCGEPRPVTNKWICPSCGKENEGNFCTNCGSAKPVSGKWICPSCGKENEGKFCSDCGTKKPE